MQALVAPHTFKTERFEAFADALKSNSYFPVASDSKSVRDRYERLQWTFNKTDRMDLMMCGTGREVAEVDGFLFTMREARDEVQNKRDEENISIKERELSMLDAGARVVPTAMKNGVGVI